MTLFSHKKPKQKMPIKFSDLQNDTRVQETQNPESVIPDAEKQNPESVIPEQLLNDPQAVGYVDFESQQLFYQMATSGIDIDGQTSIIDMGCGRGDFFKYIRDNFNDFKSFTGYELNHPLILAGKEKYKDFDIDFHHENYLQIPTEVHEKKDWVFNILAMSLNYDNHMEDKWDYFDKSLEASMRFCTQGAIFIILADNGGIESYVDYPMDEVIKRIKNKYRFAIDNTQPGSVYKLGIIN